jgi:hypothetical protein
MFDVNVKIIGELKNFITIISSDRKSLSKFCSSDKDFSRSRKLPFDRLALFIIKLCKRTLSVELEYFFTQAGNSMPCSVSAFTQQRSKLHFSFFYWWNVVLCKSYYFYYKNQAKRWHQYRLVAADGSNINLINTAALSKYFGGQSNQNSSYTLAKTFYYYDILNELILVPQIKPYRYGEMNMAYDAIDNIEEDMLMIYDRNFCNYKMVALHLWQEKERKFIIRAKESQRLIRSFIDSGKPEAIVYLPPTPSAKEGLRKAGYIIHPDTTLKVRLVRVDLKKQVEVLITNLWEEEGHPPGIFKDLYFMRWGIETNISIQKNILQVEAFSGLTVNAVLQDFYATIMIANLHSIIIKDAQKTVDNKKAKHKYPMKVNKNKSFGKLKKGIVSLFLNNINTTGILQKLHDYFIRNILPQRKGRTFERVKKNGPSKGKFRTYSNFKPAF